MTLTVKSPAELDSSGRPATASQNSENKANESPRSNPVCLEVSVVVRSLPTEDTGNPPIREEGRTVIVFDNGAVLRSTNKLPIGQTVILSNSNGRDVVCKIVSGRNLPSVKGYVEVQFIEPVNDFWGIHQNMDPSSVPSAPVVPVTSASPVVPPAPQMQPTTLPTTPRAAVPMESPRKQPAASLGSGPSFDDIPGLMSTPSSTATRPSITESESKPYATEKPAREVSSYNLSEAGKPTSLSNWQSAAPEATAEKRVVPATMEESSGSSLSAQSRDFMSKGLMAYEQPDSSANDSNKRVPMIVGIAAVVLVGVGGVYYFLRGGSAPATSPTTAAISQSSAPETATRPNAANPSSAEPSQASQRSQLQPDTETASPLQPVVEQSRAALSAVPAVVTGAAPSSLRSDSPLDSRNAKRVEKPEAAAKDSAPSPARPTISNLKMGSPKAPVKSLPGSGDGIAPATELAQGTGAMPQAGLLTAAGRISSQPAPPPSALGSSAVVPAASAPINATKNVQDPKLISSTRLVYPLPARQANVQGTVALALDIDAAGKVVGANALSGPLLLRQAAIDAVKQWKYSPGLLDGKPAAAQVTVKVEFRLN